MIIKVPNYTFTLNENTIIPDELVLFMFLFKYKNADNEIFTSLNLIGAIIKFQKGNDRKNRPFIKNVLLSLQNKGLIMTNVSEDTSSDDIISGSILNVKDKYIGVKSNVFDEILKSDDFIRSKLKLYIYTYIHGSANNGRVVDLKTLSVMCKYFDSVKSYSVSAIARLINEMDGKFIYKFSGKRKGDSLEQESNRYYTHLDSDKMREYKQINNKKKKVIDKNKVYYHCTMEPFTIAEFKEKIRDDSVNWQKYKPDTKVYRDIDYDDYELYRISVDFNLDESFNSRCNKAIDSLKKNMSVEIPWNEWEERYLEDKKLSKQTEE
ncbi:hypothetical protein BSK59_13070 [Paenibacillus odorifer]|uniref:hypothetical protein n=1 Tax=Paenibacillus odorifer TaxID=189426 RepID=UPI00096F51C4|nr:hypothetical protein [Paenibacillus odorifer]OME55404.1 hypothetical protein BSK59_13070 [Paenibacillus odorifer]